MLKEPKILHLDLFNICRKNNKGFLAKVFFFVCVAMLVVAQLQFSLFEVFDACFLEMFVVVMKVQN